VRDDALTHRTGPPGSPDPEEQEWIRRCRNGSRRAYEPLVRRYARWAQAHAYRRIGDREEARDLAQEAFARAFHAMPRFRLGRPFRPWFLTILDNVCRSYLRKRRPKVGLESVGEPAGDGGMRSVGQRLMLEKGLRDLPEEQRRVVVMRDMEGYVHREVAERLGIPEGTVMSRLHNARRKLRRALAGGRGRGPGPKEKS
jgi:RNA polymerase sigma-70 factor (ECF subfamily)